LGCAQSGAGAIQPGTVRGAFLRGEFLKPGVIQRGPRQIESVFERSGDRFALRKRVKVAFTEGPIAGRSVRRCGHCVSDVVVAFSSEKPAADLIGVETGSRQENAPNQESGAGFDSIETEKAPGAARGAAGRIGPACGPPDSRSVPPRQMALLRCRSPLGKCTVQGSNCCWNATPEDNLS